MRKLLPTLSAALISLFAAALPLAAQTTIRVPADQPTIQAGINAATTGSTVLVSPGTYYENIDFKGKDITVTSSAGAASTTIDGQLKGPTVSLITNEPRSATLSGFSIINGAPVSGSGGVGGDVYISGSMPSILNNQISQSYGGIDCYYASPRIQGNHVFNNQLNVYVESQYLGLASVMPTVITGNTIEGAKGYPGIFVEGPVLISITNNNIFNNSSTAQFGGGIFVTTPSTGSVIAQNLIYGNTGYITAGGLYLYANYAGPGPGPAQVFVVNNTLANNTVLSPGTGITAGTQFTITGLYGLVTAVNNIIVGPNSAVPAIACESEGTVSNTSLLADHNLVYNSLGPAYGGQCTDPTGSFGNIAADPKFISPAAGNYQLSPGSPAIDTGNNSAPALTATDLVSKPRLEDATGVGYPVIDMGAYETAGLAQTSPTTIVLTPSAYNPAAGAPITLVAALASPLGKPTGTATFFADGAQIGTAVIDSTGTATLAFAGFGPGLHALYVTYPGQGSFTPAVSVLVYVYVNLYATTLTLGASPNPALVSTPVTFTVNATSTAPSGVPSPVTLTDTSTNTTLATLTPNASGVATFSTSSLSLGYHQVQAKFAGNATMAAATASVTEQIITGIGTTSTLLGSPNPSVAGQLVTLTSIVTSESGTTSPGGTVTFGYNGTVLGSATLTPSGTSQSTASITTSTLPLGKDYVYATYVPAAGYVASIGPLYQQINSGYATTTILTSSLNPSNVGQAVTLTANVGSGTNYTGPFTGSVTFTDGSTTLATVPLSSIAANMNGAIFTTSTLAIGTHNITATFTSTSAYGGSSATVTQLVRNPTPPTGSVSVSPEPGVVEQDNLVFTATLVPPANEPNAAYTGTILFTIDGANAGSGSLGSGGLTATYTDTSIHASGTHTISAVYSGDTVHAAATFTGTHVITTLPIAPTITAAVNPIVQGQIATLSTAFNPAYAPKSYVFSLQPQGTLSYYDGGVLVAQVAQPSPTRSSVQLTGLAPGKHIITVSYSGDTYFSPGTSQPLTLTVQAPVSLTLTASLPAVQAGKPDIFTVTLTPVGTSTAGTPTGTVTYFADGNQIGTVAVTNGLTTLSSSNLSVGPHAITCLYSGDTNYAQATCTPLNITVTAAPTALALTATPNPSVAFTQVMLTATLTSNGLPLQGAINFAVDGVAVFTANAGSNGVASLPYAALTAGPHTISATYAATANYNGSTAQFTETVTPVITSTVLQAQPNPAQQGQTITMAATIAPLGAGSTGAGFSGSVQFYDGPNLIGTTAIQVVPGLTPQFAPFTINTLAPGTHSLQAVFVSTSPSFLGSTSAPLSLTVNPSDLNLSTTSPTLTLQTEHHGDLGVTLTSIGGLTGRFTLTCGTLPYPASCSWAGASVYLPGGGSVTTSLHIDTDIVLGFKSSLDPQDAPQRPGSLLAETLTLAALLPLGLLVFTRRKRLPPLAALAVMLLVATSLTGCGDRYPDHVAPGTYAIQITATGTPTGASTTITKTATFKLVVTQ